MLTPMLRGLEEMALMPDSNVRSTNSFIVEVLPELRAKIVNGRNWKEIAEYQFKNFFSPNAK